jgi:hypothetical protein
MILLCGEDRDAICNAPRPGLERVGDFAKLFEPNAADEERFAALRYSELSGRSLAIAEFAADLENILGRPIARRAPQRKSQSAVLHNRDCCNTYGVPGFRLGRWPQNWHSTQR